MVQKLNINFLSKKLIFSIPDMVPKPSNIFEFSHVSATFLLQAHNIETRFSKLQTQLSQRCQVGFGQAKNWYSNVPDIHVSLTKNSGLQEDFNFNLFFLQQSVIRSMKTFLILEIRIQAKICMSYNLQCILRIFFTRLSHFSNFGEIVRQEKKDSKEGTISGDRSNIEQVWQKPERECKHTSLPFLYQFVLLEKRSINARTKKCSCLKPVPL